MRYLHLLSLLSAAYAVEPLSPDIVDDIIRR